MSTASRDVVDLMTTGIRPAKRGEAARDRSRYRYHRRPKGRPPRRPSNGSILKRASASPRRDQSPATRGTRDTVDPAAAVEVHGTVKWFNAEKGFGFVGADDGEKDIFIHISVLEKAGLNNLAEGQQVTLRVVQTPKGREAARSIKLAPFA